MTRIYLDVCDRVCFDTTPNHEEAKSADSDRALLRLLSCFERLGTVVISLNAAYGQDALNTRQTLLHVRAMKSELIAGAG